VVSFTLLERHPLAAARGVSVTRRGGQRSGLATREADSADQISALPPIIRRLAPSRGRPGENFRCGGGDVTAVEWTKTYHFWNPE
jgi:hypothetical protein